VFVQATRQLEANDAHTVEVSFRLRVMLSERELSPEEDEDPSRFTYQPLEGKGMLMHDRLAGVPSHTMWVIRPAPEPEALAADSEESALVAMRVGLGQLHQRSLSDPIAAFPFPRHVSTQLLLCRICEREIPAWFFEKHNETCNETNRLEMDVGECNERLTELRQTIRDLEIGLERVSSPSLSIPSVSSSPLLEYRGLPLLSPPPALPSALEGLKGPLSVKPNPIRKAQQRHLEQLLDIVQTAIEISTPSVAEDTEEVPIEKQRLLSPDSENKMAYVMRWQRPAIEDRALAQMAADVSEQVWSKFNTVNRLRNTIIYAETVRQEWEAKAQQVLGGAEDEGLAGDEQAPSAEGSALPSSSAMPVAHLPGAPKASPSPTVSAAPGPRDSSLSGSGFLGLERLVDRRVETPGLSAVALPPLSLPNSPRALPHDPAQQRRVSGSSSATSPSAQPLPLSPRIPPFVPSGRAKAPSIHDFEILKPISKGAFGSVFLSKKKTTGDYYAVKVLKKSDMVVKNQVTNVKAERMIMMLQADSDFVVKLFYTFQSRDYLYLVMEFMIGGDLAALIKGLGSLDEDWARTYTAEVVLGLEYLHDHDIVHRYDVLPIERGMPADFVMVQ
jgi:serine/threonine-protein kinase RIM15